jgi:hypothetical protein
MLEQVQLEIARLENQEAIIDGFGVLSGRVKGGRRLIPVPVCRNSDPPHLWNQIRAPK